jgi:nicotinamide phosphoribosyltransferase
MNIKRNIIPYFEKSSDVTKYVLPVAVNDFGFRGAMGYEAAVLGGMGHLVHFTGSDNMAASRLLKDFYAFKGRAKSVWATEHSVATAYGPGEGEIEYLTAQLTRAPLDMIVSNVIDSYNADNYMQNIVSRPEIMQLIRDRAAAGGRTIFRPDTGKPIVNVCKYSDILGGIFGFTINSKGYKVLKDNVGIIQGDGMTEESIPALYADYIKTGWAADNILTGSGGGLLVENLTRDTSRWAIKASYGEKDGVPFTMRKNPAGDPSKASKEGLLKLHKAVGYHTIQSSQMDAIQFAGYRDNLTPVYEDGKFTTDNFENIIQRAEKGIKRLMGEDTTPTTLNHKNLLNEKD